MRSQAPTKPPANEDPQSRRSERAFKAVMRWVVANPLPTVTLVGLALYAVLRHAYTTFYSDFGLTPDEIGLTYADVLGRAAVLLGAVIVFFVVSLIVVLLWMSLLRAVFKRTPFIRRSRKLYREDALETGATGIALMLVLTLVVLIGVLSLGQAHDAAVLTKQGRGAPSGALQVIEAEPVRLGWTDRVPSGMGELSRHRLIFLGQSGGETFIYDADDAQTVRLPSELIALFFPNP